MTERGIHVLKEGQLLHGRYEIREVLGQGGFGITYKGLDHTLDIAVAIKEYYPQGYVTRNAVYSELLTITQDKYKDAFERGKEKFLKEARTVARFQKERGIVSVNDFFEENNTAYIVMEYLEGLTLKQYIDTQGLFDAAMLRDLMAPVIEALDAVHGAGLIHRDISPDNIMLLPNGTAKLMDFGAARDYTEFGEKSLSILLKHGYAPEEQYRTHGVQGPWTDIYALCATMYRCITGILPPQSIERMQEDTLKSPSELGFAIPSGMEAALMKGMAIFAKNRYQDVGELCEDMYRDDLVYERGEPEILGAAAGEAERQSSRTADERTQERRGKRFHYQGANAGGGGYTQPAGYERPRPAEKKSDTPMKVLAVVLLVCIVGVATIFWRMQTNIDKQIAENESPQAVEEQSESNAVTQTTTEAQTTEEAISINDQKYQEIAPYLNNDTINTTACLTPNDYAVVTSGDGSFSFGYPKYMFNSCVVDEDGTSYNFTFPQDGSQMNLYVHTQDHPGDSVENAKELYEEYLAQTTALYTREPKEVDSQGISRGIIAGDDSGISDPRGTYVIAANDGKKDYILEVYYPDPDTSYDYDDINYVVDCIYRYCSFSGTTYKPRTYQQFLKDDMGSKK